MRTFKIIRRTVVLLTTLMMLLVVPAYADQLILPGAILIIGESSFEGDTSLDDVILPYGVTTIESRAFADSSVKSITLPGTLTYIAPDAFAGVENLSIAAGERSYAYEWALDNDYFISRTIAKTDNVSVRLDANQLTINVRGISQADKAAFLQSIEDNILNVLENRKSFDISGYDLVDAEKFDAEIKGYDALLCWAATAANMLWISNYAEQVINPATGNAFGSVDEVFDYFRQQFTDEKGRPDGALSVFFDGEYPFTESVDWAQLRDADNITALMPGAADNETFDAYAMRENVEKIRILDNLMSVSAGVLLRNLVAAETDPSEFVYGSQSHWVTAVGVIMNTEAEDLETRYKAILIANSDNNSIYGNMNLPAEEKAAQAANAINTYQLYPLLLKDYGENLGKRWTIAASQFGSTVIDWIAVLNDFE